MNLGAKEQRLIKLTLGGVGEKWVWANRFISGVLLESGSIGKASIVYYNRPLLILSLPTTCVYSAQCTIRRL